MEEGEKEEGEEERRKREIYSKQASSFCLSFIFCLFICILIYPTLNICFLFSNPAYL